MISIAIANQKGGCGKTTLTFHLGNLFAMDNKKTILIDIDPQGNLTSCFIKDLQEENNIRLIFEGKKPIPKEVGSNLFLIGSDITLSKYEADAKLENFFRLNHFLKNQDFDITLIDTPPSLGLFTSNALLCANYVLIPLDLSKFSLLGLADLLTSTEKVKEATGRDLKILGIVFPMVQERLLFYKDVREELNKKYMEFAFNTIIPESVKVRECIASGKPIFSVLPEHKVSLAYRSLYEEIRGRLDYEGKLS